jgi:hypothetical protein
LLSLGPAACATRDRSPLVGEPVGATKLAWTKTGAMSVARTRSALAPLGGGALIAGGFDGSALFFSTAERWDAASGAWTKVASMRTPHADYPLVALADGRVAAIGGGYLYSGAEVYDPTSDGWTSTTATLRRSVIRHAAVRLADGRVLVAGGAYDSGSTTDLATSDADLFDPSAKSAEFAPTGALATARESFPMVLLAGGDVLAIGGRAASATMGWDGVSTAERWSPSTGKWSPAGAMATTRALHVAVRLLDGRVLVAGGEEGNGAPLTSAEIYDPAKNTWQATADLAGAHDSATAVLLPDGRVLVAGGFDGDVTTSSTELFDPATRTWSKGPALVEGRQLAQAVLLADAVLLAGGEYAKVGGAEFAYSTAELQSFAQLDVDGGVDAPDARDAAATLDASDAPAAPDAGKGTSPTVVGDARSCKLAADCASGFCVDGVCCDAKCDAPCSSCALPWSPGKCAQQPYGYDLRHRCGAADSCTATCGAAGDCVPVRGGEQCAPSACTDQSHGVGPVVCAAAGASCPTSAAVPFDCGAFACVPAFGACRDRCSTTDDCATGFFCDVPSATCVAPPASADGGGCGVGGAGRAGAFAAAVLLGLGVASLARRRAVTAPRGSRR